MKPSLNGQLNWFSVSEIFMGKQNLILYLLLSPEHLVALMDEQKNSPDLYIKMKYPKTI